MTTFISKLCVGVCLVTLLLFAHSSGVLAASETEGQIGNVEVTRSVDADGDGRYSAFAVEVTGNMQVEEGSIGDQAGDPYLRVFVGGQLMNWTSVLSTDKQTVVLEVPRSALQRVSPGQRTVRVELVDKDGEIDGTGLLSSLNEDGVRAGRTVSISVEPTTIRVATARENVPVGATISLNGSFICKESFAVVCVDPLLGGDVSRINWQVADRPAGSDAKVRSQSDMTATFRPDTAGNFTLTAYPVDNPKAAGTTVTIRASNTSNWSLVTRHAPIVHFARGTEYYPTRYEAFFTRSRPDSFECNFGLSWFCNSDVTTYDLGGGSSISNLVLEEPVSQYRRGARETKYPATIYGSVTGGVTYRGSEYTAITYWFFYLNDPKPEDGIGAYGFDHQSDLETVTILRNESGPQYVATSQHYGGEVREWEKAPTQGSHPEVYPAVGAHSSYLNNSQRYDGDGFYPQAQFMHSGAETASVWSTAVNNLGSSATLLYHDETGNHTTWRPSDYQLGLLTGREVWADYGGRLGTGGLVGDGGRVATRRTRWTDIGKWLEKEPLPDEKQIDAAFDQSQFDIGEDTVQVLAEVVNGAAAVVPDARDAGVEGMKPHQFWVVLEAKPEGESWRSDDVRLLASRSVRVGTDVSRDVTLEAQTPSEGKWDYRIRLLLYSPSVSEEEDVTDTDTPLIQ